MRKTLFAALIAAAAVAISACQTAVTEDPGSVVSKDFKVGDFKEIESAGSYDVVVTTGSAASVRAEGPEKMLADLKIEVKGEKLQISRNKGRHINWGRGSTVKIAVTVPELRGASVAGSGNMTVDKVKGEAFEANIAGSGELLLPAIEVNRAEFVIAGSGSAKVGGKATASEISIAGSGDVDASGLEAQDLEVSIAGSGSIDARATGTVTGAIMGSGSLNVTGGAKCDVKKMGSGSVNCS